MKRILVALTAALLAVSFLTIGVSSVSEQPVESAYTITEAYEYPILPGDEGWDELSPAERHAAVWIDPSIINSMTTEALMETAFTAPLTATMFLYDTIEEGVKHARLSCPALDVLMDRPDLREKLTAYRDDETHDVLKVGYAKRLLIYLNQKDEAAVISATPAKKTAIISPCYFVDPITGRRVEYLYTPRNSSVMSYYNLSFSDHNTYSAIRLSKFRAISKWSFMGA